MAHEKMLEILSMQYIPQTRERKILNAIIRKDEEFISILLDVFNYGVICGKRKERKRRKMK